MITVPEPVLQWLPSEFTLTDHLTTTQQRALAATGEARRRHIDVLTICRRDRIIAIIQGQSNKVAGFVGMQDVGALVYLHSAIFRKGNGLGEALFGAIIHCATQEKPAVGAVLPDNIRSQALFQLWGGELVSLTEAENRIHHFVPLLQRARPSFYRQDISGVATLWDHDDESPIENQIWWVTREAFWARVAEMI